MIVYNVTTKISEQISDGWLQWLNEEHIPQMLSTGLFTHAVVLRLLEQDEEEGPTYAVQYHALSKSAYNQYISEFAEGMRQKSLEKWGDQFIAFRTLMQIVQ